MPFDLQEHPGLLYVVATLLPLASFVLLLLVAGVRVLVRSLRPDASQGQEGGRPSGRGAAYVATGAIALSCVLSVVGFVWHYQDEARRHEAHEAAAGEEAAVAEPDRWTGRLTWAFVGDRPEDPEQPAPASALQLGYHIDNLTAVMFVMVTFVATLIHVFSIGYMGDELAPVVEDHQVHTEEGHLHRRGRFARFFLYLSLFCFSMLNLVLADNLFQVFVSWELVGICSYLLIGHYFERHSASTAANKAFIVNRVGDAGFIIGLLILWTFVGTFNFQDLFQQIRAPIVDPTGKKIDKAAVIVRADPVPDQPGVLEVAEEGRGSEVLLQPVPAPGESVGLRPGNLVHTDPQWQREHAEAPKYRTMPYWLLVLAGLGIFLGCVGKSAQFPLHVWLPDAMEGPTPVSALIHAATMVAAGVYLVGRVFPLFTADSRLVIAYTGGITLFVAATIAVVMTDIKKVLAYSTVSQLGYMMLALGVGGWVAGLFHLLTHAFFKALLFLGSGSVIHGCHHEQDMLKMGGLYPKMKITALTMLVGVLAIAGTPLFSGWYSKDAILAQAAGFARLHPEHALLFLLPLATAGLTTFYMYRMWFMTFTGRPRDEHVYEHAHESPPTMTVPLVVLALCSIFVAWGLPPWHAENSWLEGQLHHAQPNAVYADFGLAEEEVGTGVWTNEPAKAFDVSERYQATRWHGLAGNLALGLMVLGVIFAWLLYYNHRLDPTQAKVQFAGVHRFLSYKWYFDEFYDAAVVRPALVVGGWCRAFDTYVIDGFVNSLGRLAVLTSRWDGFFDARVVDGLVNLTAQVFYAIGGRVREVQTGYLRSYILFLALAALGIFVVLSYVFVALAAAR
jgi:NADH-quinone oxidoreductase subunit L